MAKDYRTHFCMLHQISRRSEERKDKRPEKEDLKGSGGFEEFPDLILLLHRPKAYKQFRIKDEIELTIAKQRDGQPKLTVVAEFIPDISRLDRDRFAADKTTEDEDPY
jgi:replicative DNA helicase